MGGSSRNRASSFQVVLSTVVVSIGTWVEGDSPTRSIGRDLTMDERNTKLPLDRRYLAFGASGYLPRTLNLHQGVVRAACYP